MQNSHRTLKRTLSNNAYLIISALFLLLLIAILCIFGYTPTNDGEGYLDYARIALAEHQPYPSPKPYSDNHSSGIQASSTLLSSLCGPFSRYGLYSSPYAS